MAHWVTQSSESVIQRLSSGSAAFRSESSYSVSTYVVHSTRTAWLVTRLSCRYVNTLTGSLRENCGVNRHRKTAAKRRPNNQESTGKIFVSICVAASPRRTTLDGYVWGPHRAAIGHMVQGHCDVQGTPYFVLVAWGVPPGAEDPLSRANRGSEWANIPRST